MKKKLSEAKAKNKLYTFLKRSRINEIKKKLSEAKAKSKYIFKRFVILFTASQEKYYLSYK